MKKIKLVLASASPRRKEILEGLGFEPRILPSDLEEKVSSNLPEQAVGELSRQKAEHVYSMVKDPQAVIIGADTVVSAGGEILGKPRDKEDACRMIRLLSGDTHQVYTGVTLIQGSRSVTFAEKTDVEVYPLTEEEIQDYAGCGEPMDKAGGYGIQGRFGAFIKSINGSYTNVVGLPAGRTYQELKKILED